MNHHDAEITDVVVVLEDLDDAKTQDVVKQLMSTGMTVSGIDNDNSTVEGSIVSEKVHDLKKVANVRYVRSVASYTVDYPPGDPRDLDGPEDAIQDSND